MGSQIKTSWVKIPNQTLEIDAYLATPDTEGVFPGVVVIQEIFGVNHHIRNLVERFAKAGYIAIAPALYQRIAPGFETGYNASDLEIGREYKNQTKAEELISDIQASIDYLKKSCPVKTEGFGTIGFCFGGHVAYLVATLNEIKATASFYGAGITSLTPGGGEPTITKTPEIKGTIYGFFGTEDPLIANEEVDEIETALKNNQIPHQIFRYDGAGHGFFCDQRGDYRSQAAGDAWNHVLELFGKML